MEYTGLVTKVLDGATHKITELSIAETIIFDIAVILIISAVLGFIARILKQPLIPAYILTGLILGPIFLGVIKNFDLIFAFSEIGIAFLLFTAGLEISFKKIKEANFKKIALIGLLQVALIIFITIFLGEFLGLNQIQSVYVGIILAFGSTMVDIKLLSDRGELITLHGRLVLGILLLQDLIAIAAIVIFKTGGFSLVPIVMAFGKLLIIISLAIILQGFVLNKLFRFAARSTELLFLSSLAVLFLFIVLAYSSGLSIIIGAFIAGVSLANSPFKSELGSRIFPLRDFFAILFFVSLGMQIVFEGIGQRMVLLSALLIGAFLVKPFITFFLLRTTGYKAKTSFLTSISLAQLSEFSLIIGILGVNLGVLDPSIFSTVILATIITMSITPYLIEYKEFIYKFLKYPLELFMFLPTKENLKYEDNKDKEILLVGAHRMGSALLKELKKKKEELLVIDYNPEIINALINKKISCIYGDICGPDLLNSINVKKLKMVISTVPGYEENLYLLKKIKRLNKNIKVVLTGSRISETNDLYSSGADYVITPKILAGDELKKIIHSKNPDLKKLKRAHLSRLGEIHNVLY
tara:strand:- start:10725 stop:12467 length:1743 start_codon:yes stop_codon:yes gene_type:complete